MEMMKITIFLFIIALSISEDQIPETLPQFKNAFTLKGQKTYKIITDQRTIQLINIPDILQSTSYSCGPSSLKAVLHYYKVNVRESQVMKAAGTQPNKGTGPKMLQEGFHRLINNTQRSLEHVLSFQRRQNMSVQYFESNLRQFIPVIVLIQHFKPADDPTPYSQYNGRGHYIVAIGMDDQRYYFEDPKYYNNIVFIKKSEFVDRWHDYLSTEQRYANRVGLIVKYKNNDRIQGQNKVQSFLN